MSSGSSAIPKSSVYLNDPEPSLVASRSSKIPSRLSGQSCTHAAGSSSIISDHEDIVWFDSEKGTRRFFRIWLTLWRSFKAFGARDDASGFILVLASGPF